MRVIQMPRPKSQEPTVNFNARIPASLREKASVVAANTQTDLTKQVRAFFERYVAEYEKEHGPIDLNQQAA